ncbi:unannotated protein [freshwater metagenome]|uniref:Unannotated protein n=1 Tax=freshwater metagenome TaxID=449393 RepID=A0A6J7CXP7_9ZZZZ|nr:alpha/beta hydrolase [Actinomycetota bacterium]
MRSRAILPLVACVVAGLAIGVPVATAEPTVTVTVGRAPETPSKYNKVFVTKFGAATARKVLVLVPGTSGGAGNFTLVAREIVRQLPAWQVWALDRREQALEDTSRMEQAYAGTISPQQALDYYLGWFLNPAISPHFTPRMAKDYGFMRNWGMRVNLEDIRRVVLSARRGGRTVVLGGHSLGASLAAGYAAWSFGGKPGYQDIDGIVAIDGGLLGSFGGAPSASSVRKQLAALRPSAANPDGPWLNLLGLKGFAWTTGPFAEIAGLAALKEPDAPSILSSFPLVPPMLKPSYAVTNVGALGYAFDANTSPDALSLIQVRAGQQAAGAEPRGWQDGEVTPIANLAAAFAQGRVNGVDWYYPARLNIDLQAANTMRDTAAGRVLGLRFPFLKRVKVPFYAFQTSLTAARNGVVNGARAYVKRSRIPRSWLVTVDAGETTSHLDPLTAAPQTSRFLQTVIPFLRDVVRTRR